MQPSAPASATPPIGTGRGTGAARSDLFDPSSEVRGYQRSPRDLIRFLFFAAAAAADAAATHYLGDGLSGLENQLTALLDAPVGWVRAAIDVLLIATVVLATVVVLVVPLATRRLRLFGYVLVALVVTGVVFAVIGDWVGLRVVRLTPDPTTEALARTFALNVAATAQLAAAFVTIGPFVGRRWRRLGAIVIGAILVMQLIVVSGQPTHALLVITVGPAVGCAVLLAFGRPLTRPRASAILDALRRNDLTITGLRETTVGRRGTLTYVADVGVDGEALFVKVLGANRLAADQLLRVSRWIRFRDSGDERPFSSVRRSAEHEALLAGQALQSGARTPALRCISGVGDDAFLLAYDLVPGTTLGEVDPATVTDEVLDDLWAQVARLHRRLIAHRRLQPSSVRIDGDGRPWLTGVSHGEVAATESLLRTDVAQLLAATAVMVGVERAVRAAIGALGPETVATTLGRVQRSALSGTTRTAVKAESGLLEHLRKEIQRQCSVAAAPLEPMTRFTGRQVFTVVMIVAVVYFLVPQFADLPAIFEQVRDANWWWALPALAASAATYVAAALAILGSTPGQMPFGSTVTTQVASSFTSTVAPAGLGGMALNVRFLQRQGIDGAVATSAVGLDAVGGVVGHVVLIAVFVVWAGRDAVGDVELPSPQALLVGVAVVVGIAALTLLLPSTRRMVRERLVPIVSRSLAGLRDVLTNPAKVALLLGGSILVTGTYLVAFVCSTEAFDIDVRFASLGAVYLIGAALATIAPTPGGLGATEAALIGGLVAVGVSNDQALPAVFLFRLVTFWIPILPGWIAFVWLRRTERI